MVIAGRLDAAARSEASTARWWQLIIGIVCMAMIANLQYGWTLFVPPIERHEPGLQQHEDGEGNLDGSLAPICKKLLRFTFEFAG